MFDHADLDSQIDELERLIPDVAQFEFIRRHHEWGPIWSLCGEIQRNFKETHYPAVADRQRAWQRFQEIRLEASKRKRYEDEGFLSRSTPLRDDIMSDLRILKVDQLTDFMTFHTTTATEVKALGQALRDVRQRLRDVREQMIREHWSECRDAVEDVKRNHDWWWEEYKNACDARATARLERQREFEQRQRDREEHRRARRQHYREVIERLEASLERALEARARTRERRRETEAKLAETTSEKWEGIFSEWLSDIDEKLDNIDESINNLREWIAENEAKLRGL